MKYVLKTNLGYFSSTGWLNLGFNKNYTDSILKATLYKSSAAIKGVVSHAYRHSRLFQIWNTIDWDTVEIIMVEIAVVSKEKFTPKDE